MINHWVSGKRGYGAGRAGREGPGWKRRFREVRKGRRFPDHRNSSSKGIRVKTGKSGEICVWGTELALICT